MDLPTLLYLTVPRSFFSTTVDKIESHVFGVCSQETFSEVACLRGHSLELPGNTTPLALVIGKARVALMKTLTVPKLELKAALLAARLLNEVHQALIGPLETTYLWIDSTTVLQWLYSLEKKPIFIANRASEILDLTTVDQWNYMGKTDNPADAGTRGPSAEALKVNSSFTGPEFLRTPDFPLQVDDTVWQSIKKKMGVQQLFVSVTSFQQQTHVVFDWTKHGSFSKIVRKTAYILRLLPSHRHFRYRDLKISDSVEMCLAEEKVLLLSQRESVRDELKYLFKEKSIANHRRLLSPSTGRTKTARCD